MPIPVPLRRPPTARQVRTALGVAAVLLLAGCGALLLTERPGLRGEYFALGEPWQGKPFTSRVGAPRLDNASQVGETLMTKVVFSIRWDGWWEVAQAGEHRFALDADDGGTLRIDGELLVDTGGVFGDRREAASKVLAPGFHAVEVGLYQNYGESRLAVLWTPPGSAAASAVRPLPASRLYSGRPLLVRRALRRALAGWPRTARQLLGVALLLSAILLLHGRAASFEKPAAWLRGRLAAVGRRRLRTALLLALFAVAFFASLPHTGSVRGGDDTSYLQAATFSSQSWFFNRYAHVYLLKLFTAVGGGDPFLGVRLWWSFVFATTVAALAVAVASVGPGLQLRTLAATLFALLAQTSIFGLIGAGFADYSAMMFVTAAVAVYLHGLAGARERPPPRREWHALALGALTVGAFRSKEVGAVLVLLPLLFLIGSGRIELRRFARRTAYWLAGAVGALVALMLLDAWILGDFLFTLDPNRMASSEKMNFPAGLPPRKATEGWLNIVWGPQVHTANVALRNLWLGVAAAALAAGLWRKRLEIRLLHLLPMVYLLALIVLYVRMPHPFSTRMLIPILPVGCLMSGLLLHHAGLDDVPWRRMARPSALVPGALAVAVLMLVVVPYRLGTLDAGGLLPVTLLRRYGWEPDHFVAAVLLPAAALGLVAALALLASRRRVWLAALVVAYLALFGVGFEITRASLARNWAAQASQLLLYPWRTFRAELDAIPARKVALSRDLESYFQMSATTRAAIGQLALGRQDLFVSAVGAAPTGVDAAIASRYAYDSWRQQAPGLAATARFDPAGFLVLVRPQQAAARAAGSPLGAPGSPTAERPGTLAERLEEVKTGRDPEARAALLRWILDSLEGPYRRGGSLSLQQLEGDRLRAVALSPDGWTDGARPAGLIVKNPGGEPRVQELRLTVHAAASEYPIEVFLDDGEQVETVRFERGATRRVRLRPVAPRATRLVLVWTDKAWLAKKKGDDRLLGVRIRAVPPR